MQKAHRTFISLCLAYIISQFHRSSLAVIGTDLQSEFNITVAQLGLLSSLFFLSFMGFQIPAGFAYDRIGARKTMVALLILNAFGSALFALAPNFQILALARIILGIGNSALLIGALFIVAKEFSGAKFARYSGWLLAVGTLGNLLSTMPLAYLQEKLGWQAAFWFFSLVAFYFAFYFYKNLKEYPLETKTQGTWRDVFNARDFWKLFIVQLAWYGGTMSLFALWGRPYLRDYHGLDGVQSGSILMLLPVASILSYLTTGGLDQRFNGRKILVLIGIFMNASVFLSLFLYPTMPLICAASLIAVLGFSAGFFPFMLAHGRGIFAPATLGLGMSTLNFANIGGVGFMQLITSQLYEFLLNKGYQPTEIYPKLFFMICCSLAFSGIFYSFSRDVKPRGDTPPSKT